MALIDKLSAIGDAIRAKTGETGLLRLDEMPGAIAGIQTGGGEGEDFFVGFLNDTLTEIRIPDGVTVLPENVFYNKKALKKIDLNQVIQLSSGCMQSCSNLTEVDLSKIQKLRGANNMLNGSGVQVVDLSSVTDIGIYSTTYERVFQGAGRLVEVKNFHPVKAESYLFSQCNSLKILDLSLLTETGNASFQQCAFEEIVLPSIVKIGESFTYNKATKVDIGANCSSIAAGAFKDSKNITTLIVRATTPPTLANVNAFGGSFSNPSGSLERHIYVPAESLYAYMNATNWTTFVGDGTIYRTIEDYPEITGG